MLEHISVFGEEFFFSAKSWNFPTEPVSTVRHSHGHTGKRYAKQCSATAFNVNVWDHKTEASRWPLMMMFRQTTFPSLRHSNLSSIMWLHEAHQRICGIMSQKADESSHPKTCPQNRSPKNLITSGHKIIFLVHTSERRDRVEAQKKSDNLWNSRNR